MRIAHFSDVHIEQRQPEIRRALEFIADDASANGVDLLVDAGDWWDGASRAGERNESTELQQRLRFVAPLVAVMGNHGDPRDLGPQFTEIEARCPVYVAHRPEMVYFSSGVFFSGEGGRTKPGDLLICCLPWLKKAALVDPAQLAAGEDLGEAAMAELRRILDGFRAALAAHDGPALVVAHADVAGRSRGAGDPPETGDELVIPAGWLVNLDPRQRAYIALGHEHDAQAFAPHCRYSGTPAPTTFGEAKPKSYCLVDLATDRAPQVEERRTPVAPLVKLEATWEDGTWTWDAETTQPVTAGAKVRLRYHFIDHERAAARAAAAEWARSLRDEAGALEVVLDPKQRQILRRRGEEGALTTARSTRDKLHVYWRHIEREEGLVVPALQKDRIDALLEDVERAVGIPRVTAPGVSVQFLALRVRGIGPFRDLAELRLGDLGGRLVAFVGENGAGKSTFLGMAYALLYREHPDGWQLVDRAHGKDGLVEGEVVVGGARYMLRLKVNGNSRKMEGYVLNGDGKPVSDDLARGLTSAYDRWIGEHFPSSEVARATLFAGQKGVGDLLDAQPGKRREALVQMLGQAQLQRLAAAVRERLQPPKDRNGDSRKGLREVTEGLRGELRSVEAVEGTLDEAERALDRAQDDQQNARASVEAERELLAAARDRLAAWEAERAEIVARGEAARARHEAAEAAHKAAFEQVEQRRKAHEEAQQAWRQRHQELHAAEEASEQAAKLGALEEALVVASREEALARAAVDDATAAARAAGDAETKSAASVTVALGEVRSRADALAVAIGEERRAVEALNVARLGAARLGEVRAAADALPGADADLAAVRQEQERIADRCSDSNRHDLTTRSDRTALLESIARAAEKEASGRQARDRVASVPCGGPDAQPTCEFLRDAAAVDLRALVAASEEKRSALALLDARPLPEGYIPAGERENLGNAMRDARSAAQRKRDEIAATAALLSEMEKRAGEMEAAGNRVTEARAAVEAATARHHDASINHANAKSSHAERVDAYHAASAALTSAASALDRATFTRAAAEQARDLARKAVERAGALDVLRDRLADAKATVDRAAADVEQAALALASAALAKNAAFFDLSQLRAAAEPYGNSKRPVVDESALTAAQQRHTAAVAALARAEEALKAVRAAATKADEIRAAIGGAEQAEEDHELLLRALDRTGIQALEIDEAAPGISELVNRLLEGGLGERFLFALDTKERGADGKEREGLPFLVYDQTREDPAREAREVLSGGEAVLVGAALRMAVAIYANQAAGASGGTFFADEPGAGLRGVNCRRFVALLRRAMEIGEMDKLVWVPAEGESLELADVRVRIGEGRVAVEGRESSGPAPLALEVA